MRYSAAGSRRRAPNSRIAPIAAAARARAKAIRLRQEADAKAAEQAGEVHYDFDGLELPLDFQWLRTPEPERIFSLSARPGHLRGWRA